MSKPEEKRHLKHTAFKTNTIKFIQNNLHHSEAVTAVLCQKLALGNPDTALTMEPCLHTGAI
jgi:hypothetical protein